MSQKRRIDKSSTTAAVQSFAGVMSDVPLPNGIEQRSHLERTIWYQFSRARAREDWCDMDLIWLAKIVRMEADIRTAQTELDDVGMIVENKRGTPIPNPCYRSLIHSNEGSLRSSAACPSTRLLPIPEHSMASQS